MNNKIEKPPISNDRLVQILFYIAIAVAIIGIGLVIYSASGKPMCVGTNLPLDQCVW